MTPIETVATKQSYGVGTLVSDFGVGFAALVIVGFTALLLGGFSFLTPWLLVTPPLFLAMGFVRGSSDGTVWDERRFAAASLLGHHSCLVVGADFECCGAGAQALSNRL